jgi:hypothetical protein
LPTWPEVHEHLVSRYQLLVAGDDWIGVSWAFTRGTEVIEQRVKIERGRAFANDWLVIRGAICLAERIDPVDALKFNARLALGALVLDDGRCYLRVTLPMDSLQWRDLDQAIEHVAREAARLRRPRVSHGPSAFKPFED